MADKFVEKMRARAKVQDALESNNPEQAAANVKTWRSTGVAGTPISSRLDYAEALEEYNAALEQKKLADTASRLRNPGGVAEELIKLKTYNESPEGKRQAEAMARQTAVENKKAEREEKQKAKDERNQKLYEEAYSPEGGAGIATTPLAPGKVKGPSLTEDAAAGAIKGTEALNPQRAYHGTKALINYTLAAEAEKAAKGEGDTITGSSTTYSGYSPEELIAISKEKRAEGNEEIEKFNDVEGWLVKKGGKLDTYADVINAERQDMTDNMAKWLGDLAYSGGRMAPSMLIGMGVGKVAGAVTNAVTTSATAASSAASLAQTVVAVPNIYNGVYVDSLQTYLDSGIDPEVATKKAMSEAIVETASEVLIGGMPGLGPGLVGEKTIQKIADKMVSTGFRLGVGKTASNVFGQVASTAMIKTGMFLSSDVGKFVFDVLGEGFEEVASAEWTPLANRLVIDANYTSAANAGKVGMTDKAPYFPEATGELGKLYDMGVLSTTQPTFFEKVEAFAGGALLSLVTNGATSAIQTLIDRGQSVEVTEDGRINIKNTPFARSEDAVQSLATIIQKFWVENLTAEEAEFAGINPQIATRLGDMLQYMDEQFKYAKGKTTIEECRAYIDERIKPAIEQYKADIARAAQGEVFTQTVESMDIPDGITKVSAESIPASMVSAYRASNPKSANRTDAQIKYQIVKSINAKLAKAQTAEERTQALSGLNKMGLFNDAVANGTALDLYGEEVMTQRAASLINQSERELGRARVALKDGSTKHLTFREAASEVLGIDVDTADAETVAKAKEWFIQNQSSDAIKYAEQLDSRASKYGFKVVAQNNTDFMAGRDGRAGRAYYNPDTKTLYINTRYVNTSEQAALLTAHELVHAAQTTNPTRFSGMVSDMMARLGFNYDEWLANVQSSRQYANLDLRQQLSEVDARFLGYLFNDPVAIMDLADADPQTIEGVRDFLKNDLKGSELNDITRAQYQLLATLSSALNGTLNDEIMEGANVVVPDFMNMSYDDVLVDLRDEGIIDAPISEEELRNAAELWNVDYGAPVESFTDEDVYDQLNEIIPDNNRKVTNRDRFGKETHKYTTQEVIDEKEAKIFDSNAKRLGFTKDVTLPALLTQPQELIDPKGILKGFKMQWDLNKSNLELIKPEGRKELTPEEKKYLHDNKFYGGYPDYVDKDGVAHKGRGIPGKWVNRSATAFNTWKTFGGSELTQEVRDAATGREQTRRGLSLNEKLRAAEEAQARNFENITVAPFPEITTNSGNVAFKNCEARRVWITSNGGYNENRAQPYAGFNNNNGALKTQEWIVIAPKGGRELSTVEVKTLNALGFVKLDSIDSGNRLRKNKKGSSQEVVYGTLMNTEMWGSIIAGNAEALEYLNVQGDESRADKTPYNYYNFEYSIGGTVQDLPFKLVFVKGENGAADEIRVKFERAKAAAQKMKFEDAREILSNLGFQYGGKEKGSMFYAPYTKETWLKFGGPDVDVTELDGANKDIQTWFERSKYYKWTDCLEDVAANSKFRINPSTDEIELMDKETGRIKSQPYSKEALTKIVGIREAKKADAFRERESTHLKNTQAALEARGIEMTEQVRRAIKSMNKSQTARQEKEAEKRYREFLADNPDIEDEPLSASVLVAKIKSNEPVDTSTGDTSTKSIINQLFKEMENSLSKKFETPSTPGQFLRSLKSSDVNLASKIIVKYLGAPNWMDYGDTLYNFFIYTGANYLAKNNTPQYICDPNAPVGNGRFEIIAQLDKAAFEKTGKPKYDVTEYGTKWLTRHNNAFNGADDWVSEELDAEVKQQEAELVGDKAVYESDSVAPKDMLRVAATKARLLKNDAVRIRTELRKVFQPLNSFTLTDDKGNALDVESARVVQRPATVKTEDGSKAASADYVEFKLTEKGKSGKNKLVYKPLTFDLLAQLIGEKNAQLAYGLDTVKRYTLSGEELANTRARLAQENTTTKGGTVEDFRYKGEPKPMSEERRAEYAARIAEQEAKSERRRVESDVLSIEASSQEEFLEKVRELRGQKSNVNDTTETYSDGVLDSQGYSMSDRLAAELQNSKARDDNGNLVRLYAKYDNSADANIEDDTHFGKYGGKYGPGLYAHSTRPSSLVGVTDVYANMTRPLTSGTQFTYGYVLNGGFVDAVLDSSNGNEQVVALLGSPNYLANLQVNGGSVLREVNNLSRAFLQFDSNGNVVGGQQERSEFAGAVAQRLGYDGIIDGDTYVVFSDDKLYTAPANKSDTSIPMESYNSRYNNREKSLSIDAAMGAQHPGLMDAPMSYEDSMALWKNLSGQYDQLDTDQLNKVAEDAKESQKSQSNSRSSGRKSSQHRGKTNTQSTTGIHAVLKDVINDGRTPSQLRTEYEQMMADTDFGVYEKATDEKALQYASDMMAGQTVDQNFASWYNLAKTDQLVNKKNGKNNLVWTLKLWEALSKSYDDAVANGDTEAADDYARAATEVVSEWMAIATMSGQISQSVSLFTSQMMPRLKGGSLLRYAQKWVSKFNARTGASISINDDMKKGLLAATTDEEKTAALTALAEYAAKNTPFDVQTYTDQLRNAAMLSAPVTWSRNIGGNIGMFTLKAANLVAQGVSEDIIDVFSKKGLSSRTSTVFGNKLSPEETAKMREFVKGEMSKPNVFDMVTSSQRYEGVGGYHGRSLDDLYHQVYSPMKTKLGRVASNVVFKALELADIKSLTINYNLAFMMKAKAEGYTVEFLEQAGTGKNKAADKALEEIRDYATEYAQDATFRRANKFAQWINKGKRLNSGHKAGDAALNIMLNSVAAFTKTPFNVGTQMLRYSPAEFLKVGGELATLGYQKLSNKEATVSINRIISDACAGLIGSGLVGLGYMLAAAGWITGGGSDDEDISAFEKETGRQSYAIVLADGSTYTMDWFAPLAVSVFAGVELYNYIQKHKSEDTEITDEDALSVINAVVEVTENLTINMFEPFMEMSFMSGVANAIDSLIYSSKEYGKPDIVGAAKSLLWGYISQYNPNIISKARSAFKDNGAMYSTLSPTKGSKVPGGKSNEYSLRKLANKTWSPDRWNARSVDRWGNERDSGLNPVANAALTLISPGYYKPNSMTERDKVAYDILASLGDEAGKDALPTAANRSFTITPDDENGNKLKDQKKTYYLSNAEYHDNAVTVGKARAQGYDDAIASDLFGGLTDAEKAAVFNAIDSYAQNVGRYRYAQNNGIRYSTDDDLVGAVDAAVASGLSIGEYFIIETKLSEYTGKGAKNAKAKYLNTLGLDYNQKRIFM